MATAATREWKEPKQVTIKKAANGFIVSTYTETEETVEIARTIEEANKISKRILGK